MDKKQKIIEQRLSVYLARKIFEAPHGSAPDKTIRVAFRGGKDHKETDLGGFCEEALADHIAAALHGYGW